MAKDSAIPPQVGFALLHHLATLCSAFLGGRSLVQLCVLQLVRVRRKCSHATMGSPGSRPVVDLHNMETRQLDQEDIWLQAMGFDAYQHALRHHVALHGILDRLPRHGCRSQRS